MIQPRLCRIIHAVGFVALVCFASGCATVTVATFGTVAGVAASAISTGQDIYRLGKLDTAEMARFDDAVTATRRAAADLALTPESDLVNEDGTAELVFADDKNATLEVELEPRTSRLVRIRIDVGLFGSEVTARLFLTHLRSHLPVEGPTSRSTTE